MSRLTASRAAFDLIASFEGFRTRAVLAPSGKWTLGFGHVATAREGLSVTRAEAEDLLRWDLLPIEDSLRQVALTPLTQNQFDALLSFTFNIGLENFKRSDVLKYLNQGQPVAAALSMHAWRRARVNGRVLTIDALVRRRAAEAALFLEPVGPRAAAPTSIIAPEVDQSARIILSAPEGEAESKNETETSSFVLAPLAGEVAAKRSEGESPPAQSKPTIAPVLASLAREAAVQPPVAEPSVQPPKPATVAQTSVAQASVADILREPMVVKPLALAPTPASKLKTGPIVPNGIAPFPAGPSFNPPSSPANAPAYANGNGDAPSQQSLPANDGYNTRLYAAAEAVEAPIGIRPDKPKLKPAREAPAISNLSLLTWGLMALGAALLAFGLFYSWKNGLLSVTSPRREPTGGELSALLAAGSGFIMLITAAVAAITGAGKTGGGGEGGEA